MKQVLITGATGAIGSALVPYFLAEPGTEVRLLLRADCAMHLDQRIEALWQFWNLGEDSRTLRRRLQPIMGDVCLPRLGMPKAAYASLAADTTHIIHAAGNVKLNQTIDEARRNAVDAVRHVVAFAQACQRAGRLQKLDAVSTVGVAGRRLGLLPETPAVDVPGYHNTYEEAKAAAETYLLRTIDQGLPVTIHRPSMVVGDSRNGRIVHFQVFYHLSEFLCGRRTRGLIPDTREARLDIVPVDYVARAIHAASTQPATISRILHLCSGPHDSPLLTDLSQQLRDMLVQRGIDVPPLHRLASRWFDLGVPVAARLATGRTRRALQALPLFLAYLKEEQSFDNRLSRDFLMPRGIDLPAVADYLPRIMDYYWSTAGAFHIPRQLTRSLPFRDTMTSTRGHLP